MRIFTCTPVAFGGGPDFFARDSGLFCRGFQSIGVESRAVMPGERSPDDLSDLTRTAFANLESAEWWRSHRLDGVVLYAWGSPRFRRVAQAIREAGVFLVLNQDSGGLVSPLAGFHGWRKDQRSLSGSGLRYFRSLAKGLTHGLLVTDPLRAAHLRHGHIIACVSPRAAQHYQRLCWFYGGVDMVDRIRCLPHAVEPRFRFSGGKKERQVICVGRWEDRIQKRPRLLMDTIGRLVAMDEDISVAIVGNPVDKLRNWHNGLPPQQKNRIKILGMITRDELVEALGVSRVFYSPSAFESFGIAAAEALCCGCSVVATESVSMASFEWFVSEESGRLSGIDDASGHADALAAELRVWDDGERNPARISEIWCSRLHADKVALKVVKLLQHHEGARSRTGA
jgi:glycosyltransferase involved in cell wall biosynthesis